MTFKLDVRYVVANQAHLSIIRHTEQGILIEPLDKRSTEPRAAYCIPRSSAQYVVCEDALGDIHIIYLNDALQLMHAIIRQQQADVLTSSALPLGNPRDLGTLKEMTLHCIHNTLQLFLRFHDQVIHYQLAGLHWSKPIEFLNAPIIQTTQLLQSAQQAIFIAMTGDQHHLSFLAWRYDSLTSNWKPSVITSPPIRVDIQFPLYVHSYIGMSDTLHVLTVQFPRSQLHLARYILGHVNSTKPVHESITITPIRNVQAAVLDADHTAVHISWLADGFIYRIDYDLPRAVWSNIQCNQTSEPALWNILSHDHSLSLPYPQWLSATRDWQLLNEQFGSMLDLYYTQRNFQVSVTYATASLSSIERMLSEKQRMTSEIERMEEQLHMWREQSHVQKQRIAILNEELVIRDKLTRFIVDRMPDPEQELAAPLTPISAGSDLQLDETIQPNVKSKIISMLQRLHKNRL